MKNLIVLPTLDGSREAAIRRITAWSTAPVRQRAAESAHLYGTVGERRDRLDSLDVLR